MGGVPSIPETVLEYREHSEHLPGVTYGQGNRKLINYLKPIVNTHFNCLLVFFLSAFSPVH